MTAPTSASSASSASPASFTIHPARSPHDVAATAALFRHYHQWLDIDLSFQGFEAELASLPAMYAPTAGGDILLARLDHDVVGCVALRDISRVVAAYQHRRGNGALDDGKKIAEVKRLYTLPAARGLGVGSALVAAVMDLARREGYDEVRLDTLPRMPAAIKLYSRAGFEPADKYYDTHLEGTVFMRCVLRRS